MAEPSTQNSNEIASGVTEQLVSPQTIRTLMSRTARLLADVTDILEELSKDGGVSPLVGPDDISKLSQSTGAIQRLGEQSAEIRSARKATRRREKHLAELAAELGEPEDKVFDKALAFFKDAIEAERRGDRVVIANREYDIVTELSGFASDAPSSQ